MHLNAEKIQTDLLISLVHGSLPEIRELLSGGVHSLEQPSPDEAVTGESVAEVLDHLDGPLTAVLNHLASPHPVPDFTELAVLTPLAPASLL